jgi:hypothetical protein
MECPASCTEGLEEELTVFYSQMHMHGHGTYMETIQYRDGAPLTGANAPVTVQHYNFDFQDVVGRTMTIKKGDSFLTRCVYDLRGDESAVFGLGSEQEMCINFLHYYPVSAMLEGNGGYCGAEGQCGGRTVMALHEIDTADLLALRDWPLSATCDAANATKHQVRCLLLSALVCSCLLLSALVCSCLLVSAVCCLLAPICLA